MFDNYKEDEEIISKNIGYEEVDPINKNEIELIKLIHNFIDSKSLESIEEISSFLSKNKVKMNDNNILNIYQQNIIDFLQNSVVDDHFQNIFFDLLINLSIQENPLSSIIQCDPILDFLFISLENGAVKAAKCLYNIIINLEEENDFKFNFLITLQNNINNIQQHILEYIHENEQNNTLPFILLLREILRNNSDIETCYVNDIITNLIPIVLEKTSKPGLSLLLIILQNQNIDLNIIPDDIYNLLNQFVSSSMHHHAGIALQCIELLIKKEIDYHVINSDSLFSNLIESTINKFNLEKSINIFTKILSKDEELLQSFSSEESINNLLLLANNQSTNVKEEISLLISLIINEMSMSELLNSGDLIISLVNFFSHIISEENDKSTKNILKSLYIILKNVMTSNLEELKSSVIDQIDIDELMDICEEIDPDSYPLFKSLFE